MEDDVKFICSAYLTFIKVVCWRVFIGNDTFCTKNLLELNDFSKNNKKDTHHKTYFQTLQHTSR